MKQFWRNLLRTRWMRILLDALRGYDEHHCLYMAGAISFYAMISLGPLIYLALLGLQRFIGSSELAQSQLRATLSDYMLPSAAENLVMRVSHAELFISFQGIGAWWVLLALIWAGLSFYDVLTAIFTLAWGGSTQRDFLRRKLRALAAFVGAGLFFVATMLLTGGLAVLDSWGERYLSFNLDPVSYAVGWLLPYALSIAVFFLLYKFLPNAFVPWRLALLTAIPVGIVWELTKRLFGSLAGGYHGSFYGPLAWFVLLMIWIYWSSNVVLLGAEIGAAWQRAEEDFQAETG